MNFMLIGLNHRTAPIDVREQLAFSQEGVATALLLFRNQFPGSEAAILSTCNRVELMIVAHGDRPSERDVLSFIAQARDLPIDSFKNALYRFSGEQAVRHLFRVASGLDSMVLGEYQIVNQLRQAYTMASEQGTTGRVLNHLFHQAFSTGKRVRSETEIGLGKVSIPSVAVDIAHRVFTDFTDKKTLVVGAGDMAQLVCQYLHKADAKLFTVTSRTQNNARTLAEAFNARSVPMDELDRELIDADIVVTATRCPRAVLTVERVKAAQAHRHGRSLFVLDLGVPRNVEPAVEKLDNVYLFDIDALGRIVNENQGHRETQLTRCEMILDEEIAAFNAWCVQATAQPMIQQMYADASSLRDQELARFLVRCPELSDKEKQEVRQLAERLINKLMHPCATTIKRHGASEAAASFAESLHAVSMGKRTSSE